MRRLLILILLLLTTSTVFALEFQPIGARQLGMGGAGVASTMDVTAQYYNPAIFGFFGRETKKVFKDKDFGINAQIGAGVRLENNLADNIDALGKIDYDKIKQISTTTGQNFTNETYSEALKLLSILQKIDKDQGAITVNADTLLATRIKRIGIGVYGLAEVNGKPSLDLENVRIGSNNNDMKTKLNSYAVTISDPGPQNFFTTTQYNNILSALNSLGISNSTAVLNQAESELKKYGKISPQEAYSAMNLFIQALGGAPLAPASIRKSAVTGGIENNKTSLVANGIGLLEVPLTYGHPIGDSMAVGLNLKYIQARVFSAGPGDITIFNKDSGDIADELDKYYKESTNFSVDAGLLFQPANWLKLGVVGKYLNSPEFDHPLGGKVKIKPQARAGIALNPWETLTIAADIDLTENETMNPGYKSRNIGGGIEWDILKFLALRAGIYKNLAESDIDMVYTAGLGLNLWLMRLDVSAAISSNRGRYDDKSFPEEARIQANLSIEF
ncbi:MAG: conjugal transfer protein TraF [Proteobacteria bacterium]|nr:conjugal transfer protein TraF [Pseudomonadota bacterium]